ncbi:MAG: sugar transferase [Candidatus Paceibacterota bacterium]|jgi:lipopolysaccharide/colanic/teichoic acid biosynthesis glycosyltransferase
MKILNSLKIIFLVLGDLLTFYFSLFLAILLRYHFVFREEIFISAGNYFLPVFFIWLIIFLIGRLYELAYTNNRREFFERVIKVFLANILIAALYFYIFTPTYYRPSLVLVMTVSFSFIIFIFWRTLANKILQFKRLKVLILSQNSLAEELKVFLSKNPQLGYEIVKEEQTKEASVLIVHDSNLLNFYEKVMNHVSLELLLKEWFDFILSRSNLDLYETTKRFFDFVGGIILFIISLPLWPIITLLIKIGSRGSVLHRSIRIGKNRKEFIIYKFRTMIKDADKTGPSWTLKDDSRITKIGKILRFTHLDEIPQVLNIIKGNISFVGPRPEEEKLSTLFEKEIPFYKYRFLMKPGVIGWAQINYPHGSSIEDAKKKLEYDLYYFKNRNLLFDLIIALKAWRIPFEIPTH